MCVCVCVCGGIARKRKVGRDTIARLKRKVREWYHS